MLETRSTLFATLLSVTGLTVALAGCAYDQSRTGCKSDAECRGARVCVKGLCQDPGTGTDPVRDAGGESDGESDDPADSGEPGDDARPDDGGIDDRDLLPPPIDTGDRDVRPEDTGGGDDVGPDADPTPTRPLSCHEFATCQAIACERYDYSCKQKYSSRTSKKQLGQLDARQRCVQNNCSGTQGQSRIRCIEKNCNKEWETCANRPGSGMDLDCGEFHACVHLCNGSSSRQSCLADCRKRASLSARRELRDYFQCAGNHCQGKTGRAQLECVRKHCSREMANCWGC